MTGLVHIYCGDGKGKTTASIGLAVRAAGCGKKILITRFLKTDHSGEVAMLTGLSDIVVTPCEKNFGFFTRMTEEQKKEAKLYYSELLSDTLRRAVSEDFDLLVMDEIMAVCNYGLADEHRVIEFLKEKPEKLEVVLTGREPSRELLELADYVSEIKKIKHPYDLGILARRGIEY